MLARINRKLLLNLFRKKKISKNEKNLWEKLGPGLITGASDDDPSGIATYTQAGAQFQYSTLWTAIITLPLMTSVQEMCGRIGIVTGKGLITILKENYPKWITYLVGFVTIPACIFNVSANLAGMGAVSNLLFPQIDSLIFTLLFSTIIICCIIFLSFQLLQNIMKWLTVFLLVYIITAFLVPIDWINISYKVAFPNISLKTEYIQIIVAILGTTISPYLFFWQEEMVIEDRKSQNKIFLKDSPLPDTILDLKDMQTDNTVGMFFSNLVMFFIILVSGTVLYTSGGNEIMSVEHAAQALKPLAGNYAYLLFSIGIIGTGFLSIPILAGTCSYIMAEILNWTQGINLKFNKAHCFYSFFVLSIIIAILINFLNVNPILLLIWTSIIYGVVAPILIFFLLKIANDKKIMGSYSNSTFSNLLGYGALVLMTISVIFLVFSSLLIN
jgi:NRAMP (natural resistance-associated macrophage protein)-like metal ion transporter